MNKLFKEIEKRRIKCIFVSPHYDDAAFSAGIMIRKLARVTDVVLVNVFTKSSRPYTVSAKRFMNQCGYKNASALFRDRKKEDEKFCRMLGITAVDLGFEDALFRKKEKPGIAGKYFPELIHVYPVYRIHIIKGRIAREDAELMEKLGEELAAVSGDSLVFCPMGIGGHVDHKIVREVCRKTFCKLYFWADYPYNVRVKSSVNGQHFEVKVDREEKTAMLKIYETQYKAIFSGRKIPVVNERYYLDAI
jgi:LmbE family N-acetylglucosaminyl deacetylase